MSFEKNVGVFDDFGYLSRRLCSQMDPADAVERRRRRLEEKEMELLERLYEVHEEQQQLDDRSLFEKAKSHKGGRKFGKDARKAKADKYGNIVNPYVVSL